MTKVVLAPNALKESLSAAQAAAAMAEGVRRVWPDAETVPLPIADGGDGLAEVAREAMGGRMERVAVPGPLGETVEAAYCLVPDRRLAVVEMAAASGLALVPPSQRNPLRTSSQGTGALIAAALDRGIEHLVVGIGGSATNEGGIGMAAALGVRFLDAAGQPLEPVGASLSAIESVDVSGLDPRLQDLRIEVVCDVDNPLLGPNGASAVYGPQKGADPEMVATLDAGLAHLADVAARDLGVDVRDEPGAGAAGGLGMGLRVFLGATLKPGAELVLDLVGFDAALDGAALVLTAEGRVDASTAYAKAPAAAARRARARGIPCLCLAGSRADDLSAVHAAGLEAVFPIVPGPMTLEAAMAEAGRLMTDTVEQMVRVLAVGARIRTEPGARS
ncbi:glycerate kinase [Roseospira marina]|uniref:Glycerate kinase n=1 Tax=Roseospira marina TaxID=140057 RepID=A0A5M6ICK8_9PROT|nr:glycerate kinase [Roseospira marina]KAA5605991.1 glycerate kinase [Roseospira marina]MBB4313157.1 glycerate kinase [Roseospira marina]MBB5086102.1 glycerate kinase [Roseospira marina]